jgi:hypothetical protein
VLRFLLLILLSSCSSHHNPKLSNTQLDDNKLNWVEIYRNEIKIAVDNDDEPAYHFFLLELFKEKIRLKKLNEKESNNPRP